MNEKFDRNKKEYQVGSVFMYAHGDRIHLGLVHKIHPRTIRIFTTLLRNEDHFVGYGLHHNYYTGIILDEKYYKSIPELFEIPLERLEKKRQEFDTKTN